jgi:hypothetical protein
MVAVLSVVLVLISIGTILGPVGAVVIIYHDDLTQLVITPQIRDIINGKSSLIPNFNQPNNGISNNNGNSELGGLMNPVFVSAKVDEATNTFTITFNLTNPLSYDLTLNSFSANVEITENYHPAGIVSLSNPITVIAGQTSQFTVSGSWTQDAQNYIVTNYPGVTSFEMYLSNASINLNGITIQSPGHIELGTIPINVEG